MNRDQLDGPLTRLFKLVTFINLDDTKCRPENKAILVEARAIAKTRNAIIDVSVYRACQQSRLVRRPL